MASVFYALHAQLLAEFATILDKSADAEEYTALHEKIRTAIVNKFYRPATGEFEEGTQTAQIVALWAGMPRGTAEEKKTVQAMIKAFRERDWQDRKSTRVNYSH